MKSNVEAFDEYIQTLDRFSTDDPMIVNLRQMADQLDAEFMTSLAAQYQLGLRYLENSKLINETETDEDELLESNR